MKVQDLSKELGKPVKEFIRFLAEVDIKVKTGSTKLDDETVKAVRELFHNPKKGEKRDASKPGDSIVLSQASLTIGQLAILLGVKIADVMKALLQLGMLLTVNSEIDGKAAVEIASKLGLSLVCDEPEKQTSGRTIREHLDKIEGAELDSSESLISRPPVITIMGHVDHGKTLLLDTIRKTNVVEREAGGITQHIGAYQVTIKGRKLTFLDTPGHAAFTTLRARGAQVTDIAVLVVAAEEGLKPQSIEAIHHAKAAQVPIIVAINKIDKPEANIELCKQQLAEHDLVSEDWGGKTIMVPISAKAKLGIDELLEMILLVADMLELKATAKGPAKGILIESRLSRKKGPVATVLVKSGALHVGDNFVIGPTWGKIRALLDDLGKPIKEALPGMPAEIMGISEVPNPGDLLEVFDSEKICKTIAETHKLAGKEGKKGGPVSLESFSQKAEEGQLRKLNLVLKADVTGSLEGCLHAIDQIRSDSVSISILHAATGPVGENDVMLAKASEALIFGFGVSINPEAQKAADEENIEIKSYRIIYDIVDDIQKVLDGLFKVEYEEVEIGQATVRQLFSFSKVGTIAGCMVTSGKVLRGAIVSVTRGKEEVFKGKLTSLKRFKEDVKEVLNGFECGIVIDEFQGLQADDALVFSQTREKKR